MADLIDNKQDNQEPEEGGEETKEPEKIALGDEEYKPDELKNMVGLAKKAKDIEEKHGSLDKFVSDWGKKANTIGKLKEQIEEIKKESTAKKQAAGEPLSEEEQIKQALKQADKIGLVTKENIRQYVAETLEGKELLDTCRELEEERDGSDGRPAFKTKEVLDYMAQTGFKNPEKAYKDKYWDQLTKWEREQIKKEKPKGLVTEKSSPAGGKKPKKVKVSKDNLDEMVKQALRGGI